MPVKVQITDTLTPRLQGLHSQLQPPHTRDLMARLGKTLEVELREHFLQRNLAANSDSKRAQKGFPQQGIWGRIRDTTAFVDADDTHARVAIGEPAFRTKAANGPTTIKPGPGKRFLAIPLRPEVYGKAARGKPVAGMFAVTLKTTGKSYLATHDDAGGGKQRLRVLYRLLPSVTVPPDPQAFPPRQQLNTQLERTAARYVMRVNQGDGQ